MSLFFWNCSVRTSWNIPSWHPAHFPLPAAQFHAQTTQSSQQLAAALCSGSENQPGWEQTTSWVILQPVQSHTWFTEWWHKWFASSEGKVIGKGPSDTNYLVEALSYATLRWFSSNSWSNKWDININPFSSCQTARFSRGRWGLTQMCISLVPDMLNSSALACTVGCRGKRWSPYSHAGALLPISSFPSDLANWHASWYDRDLIFSQIRKLCILCVWLKLGN